MPESDWFLKGLLFENCSCQLICPAHISFRQECTYERCVGHWAIHIDEGRSGNTDLSELDILILYDAPQRMYEGDWKQVFVFPCQSTDLQRTALEDILCGRSGGPWEVLSRFVSEQHTSVVLDLNYEDIGRQKRMWIPGMFDTEVSAIRANNDTGEAMLVNLFNQIHSDRQILARGQTDSKIESFRFATNRSHALYSDIRWSGAQPVPAT